ncbi:MAG TPA: hypothetical protein VGO09_07535, partial [Flavisolibacter sp.]|nr:hypothetical protein [Flavisolibacter sp.]
NSMIYNQTDLDNEIRDLHNAVQVRRKAFDQAMKSDIEFKELKKIYLEIKELDKKLELCFEECKAQRKPEM